MTGNQSIGKALYDAHPTYQEASLQHRRFKHADIVPLIERLQSSTAEVNVLGQSIEQLDIYEIKLGAGEKNIMLWTQMHGDEPTSTMAIFDMLHFLQSSDSEFSELRQLILSELTICFIPMLNPDGVERFQRRNAMEIDLNRDAVNRACPESRILKAAHEKNKPLFGFNLHDQSKYYNVPKTSNTASHSFLAPAYNYEKEINGTRKAAMQGIALMNEVLDVLHPNHTGRYNDDFEPRAFGDNIQLWGTSTILVEAGGMKEDPEKLEIRRMHFAILLTLLYNIATDTVSEHSVEKYWAIPENDRKLNDLILRNINIPLLNKTLDISINLLEKEDDSALGYYPEAQIEDLGDLSTFFGYVEFDAKNLKYVKAAVYPEIINDKASLEALDFETLHQKGIGVVRVSNIELKQSFDRIPLLVIGANEEAEWSLKPENKCAFFLEDAIGIKFAVINGKLHELDS